jgi:hypothetical protein
MFLHDAAGFIREAVMWKFLGVFGVWVGLIAAPHVPSPVMNVDSWVVPGVPAPSADGTAAEPGEDPGNPYQKPAEPERREAPGSFATVHFKNQMGKGMILSEALFTFDGKPLPTVEALQPDQDVVIYSGRLTPGMHLMKTELHLQGASRGPITYTKGYHMRVTAEQVLTVPDDKAAVYTIAAGRKKGMNVAFDKQIEINVTSQETPPVTSLGN